VKVSCPCKRRKEEFRCFNINSQDVPLACDAECSAQRQAAEAERQRNARQQQSHEESEMDRREAELFEKRQQEGGGSKRRRRNRRTECVDEEGARFWSKYRLPLASLAVLLALAAVTWHFVFTAE
jgi:hypothetical protein